MANERKVRWELPSSEPSACEVGYRKPPAGSRFHPGRSGNPKGRPRGARNEHTDPGAEPLKAIIVAEAYRTIKVNEGVRRITLSMAQAIVRALAVNAARGQLRSQQAFTALLAETERANKAYYEEWLQAAIQYKRRWEDELARRERLGTTGPESLPHPDDIIVDLRANRATVKGPMTKEEKAEWDRMRAGLRECEATITELIASLKGNKSKRHREFVQEEIMHELEIRKIIVDAIGEPQEVETLSPNCRSGAKSTQ